MKMKNFILSTIGTSLVAAPAFAEDKPPKKQTVEMVDGKKAAEQTSSCKVSDAQISGTLVFV